MNPLHRVDLAGGVAAAAVTVAGLMGGVHPHVEAQAEAVTLRATLSGAADRADLLAREEAVLRRQIDALERELASYSAITQATTAVNPRLAELADLARLSGVELESVRPGERVQAGRGSALPLQLSGRGELPAVIGFLSQLGDVFPDFGVARLTIDRDGSGDATISAEIRWYSGHAVSDGSAVPAR